MSDRFTIDGSIELERHLTTVCEVVGKEVSSVIPADKLEGLVLAGGYGRGEGGVLREDNRDLPYNDLEFFVFVRGSTFWNDCRYKAVLHAMGERLSPWAGLEVEFKILALDQLRRSEPSMFYYDLMMGHRWIVGSEELFHGCDHHTHAERIPLHEATRLLFNRCSGLLFAKERLARREFTAADSDFVGRNLAKAQLALGDALLAAAGRYHWSCQERHRRLLELPEASSALREHHAEGVAFKLHPHRSRQTRTDLITRHAKLSTLASDVFLNIEERRLGHSFATPAEYGSSHINKCPEQPAWKNVLVHLKSRRLSWRPTRYPREHLLNHLALMLWEDRAASKQNVHAYESLWCRFN